MSSVSYSDSVSVLREKYVGRPARRCARCGSVCFSVNLMGGLVCASCSPGQSQLDLVATEIEGGANRGRMVWVIAGEGGTSAGGAGGSRFAGESAGGFAAEDPFAALGGAGTPAAAIPSASPDEWSVAEVKPYSDGQDRRVDPAPETRESSVLVSTSLDWFCARRGGWWDREVVVERPERAVDCSPTANLPPSGYYRPLSQPYFAWLVSRVDQMNQKTGGDDGRAELVEVAAAGFAYSVFGEWVLSESSWPRLPPHGYIGPAGFVRRGDIEAVAIPWDDRFDQRIAGVK